MPKNTQNSRAGNRGSNRSGSRANRSNNNNPEGRNQYNSGFLDVARDRPVVTAAAAAGAVAAGVFLWSRRSQITEQLSNISDQLGEWSETRDSDREFETVGGGSQFSGSSDSGSTGDFIAGSGTGSSGKIRSGRASSSRTTGRTGTRSPGSGSTGSSRP